jgi:hypothetical protein
LRICILPRPLFTHPSLLSQVFLLSLFSPKTTSLKPFNLDYPLGHAESTKFKCKNVVLDYSDPALNAENIKADRGKILTPTHFSDPKDINAETWGVGVVP